MLLASVAAVMLVAAAAVRSRRAVLVSLSRCGWKEIEVVSLVSSVSMRSGVPILMKIGHPSLRSEEDSMLSAKKCR